MKVKALIEQTNYVEATIEVSDDDLLEYVNNGGEHKFETLDAARAALAQEDFIYILREFVEYETIDDNPRLHGIPVSPTGEPDTKVDKVEVV